MSAIVANVTEVFDYTIVKWAAINEIIIVTMQMLMNNTTLSDDIILVDWWKCRIVDMADAPDLPEVALDLDL